MITSTNISRNLIYQSIFVIIDRSVLVILPIITFMKDQVCITSKILYYHHLYLAV